MLQETWVLRDERGQEDALVEEFRLGSIEQQDDGRTVYASS